MNPIKEKCVVHFKLCVDFNGCNYSKGNGHATNDMKTRQWNKIAHLKINSKCNLVEWKTGYATTWDPCKIIPFWIPMQSFLYEILNKTLIQAIQCKYLLKSISEMQIRMK